MGRLVEHVRVDDHLRPKTVGLRRTWNNSRKAIVAGTLIDMEPVPISTNSA